MSVDKTTTGADAMSEDDEKLFRKKMLMSMDWIKSELQDIRENMATKQDIAELRTEFRQELSDHRKIMIAGFESINNRLEIHNRRINILDEQHDGLEKRVGKLEDHDNS